MADNGIRVLLVDDDEDEFVIMRDMLAGISTCRYGLDWIADYDEALRRLCDNGVDLCLLDYNLGSATGLDLLQAALRGGCSIPLIMLTGQDDHDLDLQAMRLGAYDYLVKGRFDEAMLERSLRYALSRKRAEDELRKSNAMLAEANARIRESQLKLVQSEKMAAVGLLAAGVAHEFNNIHAVISGYCELMLDDNELSSWLRKRITAVRDASERAVVVVRNLLSFSSLHRRNKKERCSLNTVVQSILGLVQQEYLNSNIRLDVELKSALCPVIDRILIFQVVLNLMLNARHALLGQDDKRITVSTWDKDRAVHLEVADTGCGISQEDLQHVFSPFFSTKGEHAGAATIMSTVRGMGLGLSVSYNIIREHGGEITVRSEPGKGTAFHVTLPVDE